MKEFVEKLKDMVEEKIKVTSLEIIVTGTKDKPYFEIKYKEVRKEDYNIGYSSYDLNNVFGWKEKCFEIVNELAEEYSADTPQKSANGWIPCSERLPEEKEEYLVTLKTGVVTSAIYDSNENKWVDAMEEYFEYPCIAWQPLPQSYKPQELEWKDKVMKHFTNVE